MVSFKVRKFWGYKKKKKKMLTMDFVYYFVDTIMLCLANFQLPINA